MLNSNVTRKEVLKTAALKLKNKPSKTNFKYRTLNMGSYKMFFTIENGQLVYKFI